MYVKNSFSKDDIYNTLTYLESSDILPLRLVSKAWDEIAKKVISGKNDSIDICDQLKPRKFVRLLTKGIINNKLCNSKIVPLLENFKNFFVNDDGDLYLKVNALDDPEFNCFLYKNGKLIGQDDCFDSLQKEDFVTSDKLGKFKININGVKRELIFDSSNNVYCLFQENSSTPLFSCKGCRFSKVSQLISKNFIALYWLNEISVFDLITGKILNKFSLKNYRLIFDCCVMDNMVHIITRKEDPQKMENSKIKVDLTYIRMNYKIRDEFFEYNITHEVDFPFKYPLFGKLPIFGFFWNDYLFYNDMNFQSAKQIIIQFKSKITTNGEDEIHIESIDISNFGTIVKVERHKDKVYMLFSKFNGVQDYYTLYVADLSVKPHLSKLSIGN